MALLSCFALTLSASTPLFDPCLPFDACVLRPLGSDTRKRAGRDFPKVAKDVKRAVDLQNPLAARAKWLFAEVPREQRAKLKLDSTGAFSATDEATAKVGLSKARDKATLIPRDRHTHRDLGSHVPVAALLRTRAVDQRTAELALGLRGVTRNTTVVDLTGGIGGNTLGFAAAGFRSVIAFEIDSKRCAMLQHNARVLGRAAAVDARAGDALAGIAVMPDAALVGAVAMCDPPWGGLNYKDSHKITCRLGSKDMPAVLRVLRAAGCAWALLKLPFNATGVDGSEFSMSRVVVLSKKVKIVVVDLQRRGGDGGGGGAVGGKKMENRKKKRKQERREKKGEGQGGEVVRQERIPRAKRQKTTTEKKETNEGGQEKKKKKKKKMKKGQGGLERDRLLLDAGY